MKFGLCYDLSRSYSFATPSFVQAAEDLATLVNDKGGIEGHKVEFLVQDTANEPQRGIECYESYKREGVLIFDTMSTPVSQAVLPRAMRDGNVMMQPLVGRGDAIVGDVFDWIFPVGPTYWGQAANAMDYIKQQSGGSLEDTKVAFVFMDHPFGYEPQPVLEEITKRENADIRFFPFPLPGVDQSSVWSQVRRYGPDWVLFWGISNMHVVAAREMRRNGIPMEKYIGVNWVSKTDIENMGGLGKGLKRSSVVDSDLENPLRQEIVDKVYGAGKGAGDVAGTENSYYMVGLALYSIAFEAIRIAAEQTDGPLTAEAIKAGYESIRDFDNAGLTAAVTVTPEDHGGGGKTRIESWDGETWVQETDWFSAYDDIVWSIARDAASKYED
ncbi:ABC transporter substrate-binding protein [Oceanicola sp. 22II-s10i]|uniref:ABC transporter substrate-binding protein n=1 Tax=Oceanicola sp. 22II-s10i TaxID=1317116 RepID=UPI0020CF0E0B|nr:ABC transporter substrate-binding protein [Oceanicola sp. 22II-s10i]